MKFAFIFVKEIRYRDSRLYRKGMNVSGGKCSIWLYPSHLKKDEINKNFNILVETTLTIITPSKMVWSKCKKCSI